MKTKVLKKLRREANDAFWFGRNIGLQKQAWVIYKRIPGNYGRVNEINKKVCSLDTEEEARKRLEELKRNFIIEKLRNYYEGGVKRIE